MCMVTASIYPLFMVCLVNKFYVDNIIIFKIKIVFCFEGP